MIWLGARSTTTLRNPFIYLIREPLVEGRAEAFPSPALGAAVAITLIIGLAAAVSLSYQQRRVVFYL